MSTAPSPSLSLRATSSNVEGGGTPTPRSGSGKPPVPVTTKRRKSAGRTSVKNNRRPSPSSGKESEGNSAEETSPNGSVEINRPTKPRPLFDPLALGTSVDPKSVRGIRGLELKNVGNLALLTVKQLIEEIVKRQLGKEPESRIRSRLKGYTKFQLMAELTALLSNEERNALNVRKAERAAVRKLEAAASAAMKERRAQKAAAKVKREEAQTKRAAQRTAGLGAAMAAAAVETAKASMNRNAQEYKEQMQIIVKKAKNAERAKTAEVIAKTKQKEANLHKYAGLVTTLMTQTQKDLQKLKKGGKNLSDAMVKKNKQLALATKKMEEIMTKAGKRDNFSKKNILDFISKSAKSNNKLTKKDILEFHSKQKIPTVTVKQSIGNVKAEGGKANVQIVNSKKLNREARLDQNIKRRDANYRRIVTADPMALKRQKRVFAKKRGELLKSIQKIIKSDRKTSPKIKKKVYDSYVKSPRDRISKLLKLPKKELITMIKRSTSRISK